MDQPPAPAYVVSQRVRCRSHAALAARERARPPADARAVRGRPTQACANWGNGWSGDASWR
jgi:hypothetical protein